VTSIDLDHVAVGCERLADLWPRYAGDLGGAYGGGADSPGFRFAQAVYANGMKVEALEPLNVHENDFLRRFLDASGPGPHHCTFKVPDLRAAITRAEANGYGVLVGRLDDPSWQEAFLHPKQACGIVIQLAYSAGDGDELAAQPQLAPWPAPRVAPATLDCVVHLVADLAEGRRLFVDVLHGRVAGEGAAWFEAVWPGGGRIRVQEPADDAERAWLGGRNGRLHHLAFTVADPGGTATARRRADGRYEIDPTDNLGTRLVLTPA
jgi:methylmalonyl-CoA/ethylmalonyl-CoA epimerase